MQFMAIIAIVSLYSIGGIATAYAEGVVGTKSVSVTSSFRDENLNIRLWYPASAGGEAVNLGQSIFFQGTTAQLDATISKGPFPLILLSHGAGLGGNPEALSWFASGLAQRGFIVAAPTHPYNTGPERSALETIKLWLRPKDMTDTDAGLQRDEFLAGNVDWSSVGVVGMSMGGSTALMLAGFKLDPKALAAYCDHPENNQSLCDWVAVSKVDLHKIDMSEADGDYSVDWSRFFIAIDAAPVDVFNDASVSTLKHEASIINLGSASEVMKTADSSRFPQLTPKIEYSRIEAASHFSMFEICTDRAAQIAIDEGIEEPICSDGTGEDRRAIHQNLIDLVSTAASEALGR